MDFLDLMDFRDWFSKVMNANTDIEKGVYNWIGIEDAIWEKINSEPTLAQLKKENEQLRKELEDALASLEVYLDDDHE